jgi:hypothetical protein
MFFPTLSNENQQNSIFRKTVNMRMSMKRRQQVPYGEELSHKANAVGERNDFQFSEYHCFSGGKRQCTRVVDVLFHDLFEKDLGLLLCQGPHLGKK